MLIRCASAASAAPPAQDRPAPTHIATTPLRMLGSPLFFCLCLRCRRSKRLSEGASLRRCVASRRSWLRGRRRVIFVVAHGGEAFAKRSFEFARRSLLAMLPPQHLQSEIGGRGAGERLRPSLLDRADNQVVAARDDEWLSRGLLEDLV